MPGNADLRIGLSNHADAESPRYPSSRTLRITTQAPSIRWFVTKQTNPVVEYASSTVYAASLECPRARPALLVEEMEMAGKPLVRGTPFSQTRRQQKQGRAWFGTRPSLFEQLLYPPRPYKRKKPGLAANL